MENHISARPQLLPVTLSNWENSQKAQNSGFFPKAGKKKKVI